MALKPVMKGTCCDMSSKVFLQPWGARKGNRRMQAVFFIGAAVVQENFASDVTRCNLMYDDEQPMIAIEQTANGSHSLWSVARNKPTYGRRVAATNALKMLGLPAPTKYVELPFEYRDGMLRLDLSQYAEEARA